MRSSFGIDPSQALRSEWPAGGAGGSAARRRVEVWAYRHICQEACPWNQRFAEVAVERDYAARASWEAEWDQAVSDVSNPEAVGELMAALSDEDEAVAEAAAWGLGRAR